MSECVDEKTKCRCKNKRENCWVEFRHAFEIVVLISLIKATAKFAHDCVACIVLVWQSNFYEFGSPLVLILDPLTIILDGLTGSI